MGMWSRIEDWLLALQADPARLSLYMRIGYYISLAFVLVGFAVMVLVTYGGWHP